ncbi:FtsX-like permease family protein [Micromonospora sp. NPDC049559]|uniref:FtsX-like permease family protein n=1 Tax=Micromonospora sp. NPDC049559 TaxID=3155923 RepID=UPI0034230315
MRLVLRRARQARGLLLAACVAALVAMAMITGLYDYNRQAVDAGQRSVTQAAPADERSLLISGSAGRGEAAYGQRDAAVRAGFADGLGGVPARVLGARYGTGRQLVGRLGGTGKDPVFASMVTLEALPAHADLVAGDWPRPGRSPLEVVLPERAARTLEVGVGDNIPLADRGSGQRGDVRVAGVFRPRDGREPYWLLAPGTGADGAAGGGADNTAYGPLVLDPADFARSFPGTTSASWLVEPALAGVDAARLADVRRATARVVEELPDAAGLGSSGQVTTHLDRLIDRLSRADLVGRSALLTPILLVIVLGGYTLVLVAGLLGEDRRGQTALLRARGAARHQIAGFAAREAVLVILPGVALAPLLATGALRYAGDRTALADLRLDPRLTPLTWLVTGLVAVGCLAAMLGPALRRGGTYLEEWAARSRPARWAAAQRASIDLALVALAALAWFQLRQYSSPLAGAGAGLGIDPLLAAAPTLGVLAGAVIALRLLPPVTRLVERLVSRRSWTATVFGMWQAGRRPHVGPVLLLALAVGGGTLAWSLVTTWQHSLVDQADQRVGADVRVTERNGAAPAERAGQLAALPGARAVLPAWRDSIGVGRENLPTTVLALDAAAAPRVVRGATADRAALDRMVAARPPAPGAGLPAGARRLTGTVATPVDGAGAGPQVTTAVLLAGADGLVHRLPLGRTGRDGAPLRFAVDLPTGGDALRLVGLDADFGPPEWSARGIGYDVRLTGLAAVGADGAAVPLDVGAARWGLRDGLPPDVRAAEASTSGAGSALTVRYERFRPGELSWGQTLELSGVRFTVHAGVDPAPVPAVVTADVSGALGLPVGATGTLPLPGGPLPVRVVGLIPALPGGSADAGAGVLLDLPSAVAEQLRANGTVRAYPEWWVATDPGADGAVAAAAAKLPGVTVLDRRAVARAAERDPYWRGARTGLLAAALGAVLLAVVGLGVDVWATARRRLGELAVLHTLGATPRLLARSLLAEQAFLAGIGVGVGVLVGAGVGATMAPLVILTPSGGRPVPDPAFVLPWAPVAAIAVGLLVAAMVLGALVAATIGQRVAAAQLRIGGEQ